MKLTFVVLALLAPLIAAAPAPEANPDPAPAPNPNPNPNPAPQAGPGDYVQFPSNYKLKITGNMLACRTGPKTSRTALRRYAKGKNVIVTCWDWGENIGGSKAWAYTTDKCYIAAHYTNAGNGMPGNTPSLRKCTLSV